MVKKTVILKVANDTKIFVFPCRSFNTKFNNQMLEKASRLYPVT